MLKGRFGLNFFIILLIAALLAVVYYVPVVTLNEGGEITTMTAYKMYQAIVENAEGIKAIVVQIAIIAIPGLCLLLGAACVANMFINFLTALVKRISSILLLLAALALIFVLKDWMVDCISASETIKIVLETMWYVILWGAVVIAGLGATQTRMGIL